MSAFMIGLFSLSTEVLWAMVAKLVTRAFLEKLLAKLVISGLEKLADSTTNKLDDDIVSDVKTALVGDTKGPAP